MSNNTPHPAESGKVTEQSTDALPVHIDPSSSKREGSATATEQSEIALGPIIDPEFRDRLPRLMPEEREQLKKSICSEGCRDAIIVWEDENGNIVVVDGHERLEICAGARQDPLQDSIDEVPRPRGRIGMDRCDPSRPTQPNTRRETSLIGRLYKLFSKEAGADQWM